MPTRDLAQLILAGLPWQQTPSPSREYLALPAQEPRWLIPARGRRLGSALASWSPYRLSSRFKWTAIRLANRLGVLQALPEVELLHLDNAEQIDWQAIGWEHAEPPIPLIYLGTPGPGRKAVIHLVESNSGECEAIVKVPIAPEARNAIVREASVLSQLAEERYPFSPRLLYVDRDRGIATQQFIPGHSGGRRLRPEYFELLRSLVWLDDPTNICEYVAKWPEQRVPFLGQNVDLALLQSAFEECCDPHPLPSCRIHGDFAPWNIRLSCSGAALIDWEEFQETGLPLQDAFHFLHMQDFLFHRQPRAHSREIVPFACTLGIARQLCRKLEIAYLADTYVKCCSRGDLQRCGFLRKTLALVIRDRASLAVVPAVPSSGLRLVSSHPPNSARAELLDGVIAQLNQASVPHCILSGSENSPRTSMSDVDIMFHPQDLHRIPELLAQAANSAVALFVQAIQHETTACYFVLAKEDGKHAGHLDVDCYSDYRRDGRRWLAAADVIANRRRHRDFYVPSIPDEFAYYLIKKVLKQSIECHHLKRLQHLFARNPAECRTRIANLWPAETALLLERAIVEQRLAWFETNAEQLLNELRTSPAAERWLGRCGQAILEAGRLLRRVAFPTGLSVLIIGGECALRSEIADGLVCDLAPAFRRTQRIWNAPTLAGRLVQTLRMCIARIRSTLVVRTSEEDVPARGLSQVRNFLGLSWADRLAPRDLVIDLSRRSDVERCQNRRSGVLCFHAGDGSEQILDKTRTAILHFLALRTAGRLKLRMAFMDPPIDTATEHVELRSEALD